MFRPQEFGDCVPTDDLRNLFIKTSALDLVVLDKRMLTPQICCVTLPLVPIDTRGISLFPKSQSLVHFQDSLGNSSVEDLWSQG